MPADDRRISRRDVFRIGGSLGAFMALGNLPVFTAQAEVTRPQSLKLVPSTDATTLWYSAPATEAKLIEQGLPIGNGRLGALVGGDPARDPLYLTDATLWTGGANDSLGGDGQFPYGTTDFGTFGLLAKVFLNIPGHSSASGYRRQLDLSNGFLTTTYQVAGVTYRREVYASHPDDVVVIRLSQSGGGSYTGSATLSGTRNESTTVDGASGSASFSAKLANGLKYAATVKIVATNGTIGVSGGDVTFSNCSEVLVVISGGTNYIPDASVGFQDSAVDPRSVAGTKVSKAANVGAEALLATHVADYQSLYSAMSVNLGTSTAAQKALDTPSRLSARAASGSAPDPELEAGYLQFGRYLMITSSRTGLPANLQGLWLVDNSPDWMSDYHTDINVQMNYWLPDRAGLSACFTALADYCLAQLPSWTARTHELFNDSRNGFRNSNGTIAGWTTAISTNIYGGLGWWWHPAGNAWLCNSLFDHFQYTQDTGYLRRIYPMLKGACQFWESRLISTTVGGRSVLIDDSDWSPEQGPTDAKGITYAQELVWQLFQNYQEAAAKLGQDAGYARTISGLQNKLYLPVVSPKTGWLEEWMTQDNLGETTHRHLSPLVGLFPGDRITNDASPAALLTGVRNLLTARGMQSFGWGCAWRALCWARLKDAETAYTLVMTVMKPSVNFSNGAAANLFDMYSFGSSSTFQIDANFGTPSAMIEMLVYSRSGLIELLPALPKAWSASGSVTGIGARGGFTVDLRWTAGQVRSATIHSVGGTSTTVRFGAWSRHVTMAVGGSVTITPHRLVNRRSGKVIDVPGSSTTAGTALIQYTDRGSANQHWILTDLGNGVCQLGNLNSGMLADVSGGSTADGATVIQWPSNNGTNQQWRTVDAGGGYVKLINVRSGKLLGVAGNSTADGVGIVQQTDNGDASQQWLLDAD